MIPRVANQADIQTSNDCRWVKLGELVVASQNGLSKRRGRGAPTPVLRLVDVKDGTLDESSPRKIGLTKEEIEKYLLKHGDLVCIRVNGSRNLVGRAIHFSSKTPWAFCDHFIRISLSDEVSPKYVSHYLNTTEARAHLEKHMVSTAGQNTVSQKTMLALPIPLVGRDRQEEIVWEIEKQFSRLDEAVTNLHRVKANLKRYKAAVLKAAVKGRLVETEAELARREGRTYETGEQLLQRILEEHRQKWEETELARLRGKDKALKNDKWKNKYKKPTTPDIVDLPKLPEGWVWACVDQLAAPEPNSITDGPFGSNLKSAHYTESGPRVIRLQNIKDGEFADEYAHISWEHFEQLRKHEIHAGDIAIATLGDNPPRACIIPSSVGPSIVKADCIRFKPNSAVTAVYLNSALNCQPTRERVKGDVHGVGRPRLKLAEIRAIAIPFPPQPEQERIALVVASMLSQATKALSEIDRSIKHSSGLRNAILQSTFRWGYLLV